MAPSCLKPGSSYTSCSTKTYLPGGSVIKNLPANARDIGDTGLILGQEDPRRRKWQPTIVFLPGKAHGQRSLVGYSLWGRKSVRHNWPTKQQHRQDLDWRWLWWAGGAILTPPLPRYHSSPPAPSHAQYLKPSWGFPPAWGWNRNSFPKSLGPSLLQPCPSLLPHCYLGWSGRPPGGGDH